MRARPAILVMALLLSALAGCANAPREAATRYLLANHAAPPQPATGAASVLTVGPVRLARFLDVEGIVMQTSEVAVHEARNHLWAEDLAGQLERTLRRHLARALPDVRVRGDGEAQRLTVDVDRFQGRYDGVAVAAGEWALIGPDGDPVLSRAFQVEEALTADGYAALVSALETAWRRVGEGIADTLVAEWPAAVRGGPGGGQGNSRRGAAPTFSIQCSTKAVVGAAPPRRTAAGRGLDPGLIRGGGAAPTARAPAANGDVHSGPSPAAQPGQTPLSGPGPALAAVSAPGQRRRMSPG